MNKWFAQFLTIHCASTTGHNTNALEMALQSADNMLKLNK